MKAWWLFLIFIAMTLPAWSEDAPARKTQAGEFVLHMEFVNAPVMASATADSLMELKLRATLLPAKTTLRVLTYRSIPRLDYYPEMRWDHDLRSNCRRWFGSPELPISIPIRPFFFEHGIGWYRFEIQPDSRQMGGIQAQLQDAINVLGDVGEIQIGEPIAALECIASEYHKALEAIDTFSAQAKKAETWHAETIKKPFNQNNANVSCDAAFEFLQESNEFACSMEQLGCQGVMVEAGYRNYASFQAHLSACGGWLTAVQGNVLACQKAWPSNSWPCYEAPSYAAQVDQLMEVLFHWQLYADAAVARLVEKTRAKPDAVVAAEWNRLMLASAALNGILQSAYPKDRITTIRERLAVKSDGYADQRRYVETVFNNLDEKLLPTAAAQMQMALQRCDEAAAVMAEKQDPAVLMSLETAVKEYEAARQELWALLCQCQSARTQNNVELELNRASRSSGAEQEQHK